MQTSYFYSSFGWVKITVHDGFVCQLVFTRQVPAGPQYMDPLQQMAVEQLEEYLAGTRTVFTLPFRLSGTPFRQSVFRCLMNIPYGETRTYGEVAAMLNKPSAARAVGMACHANPLHVLVPCHRVVGSNGNLTGYAAGIQLKADLLRLENPAFRI